MSANSHCRHRFPPVEFADRLEAWGAASLFGGFKLLPLDFASALGGALARRIGPFLGVSKHARRNISRAFPELSETEIARVVAGMWDNLGASRSNTRIYGTSASSNRAGGSRRTASNMWIGRSQPAGG
jgi:lauroyl/myristoyl acyltransferase